MSKKGVDRRKFLMTSSIGLASIILLDVQEAKKLLAQMSDEEANSVGLLVKPFECVGCMLCVEACQNAHGFGKAYTDVIEVKDFELFVPILCMHCKEAPCAKVCLTGALSKLDNGIVAVDQSKCIGCTFCTGACPFNRVYYDQNRRVSFKCDMCQERVSRGLKPACVEACPVNARMFGTYREMLEEGIKSAEEVDGILIYPQETSTLYVVKREWLEALKYSPIKLDSEYPTSATLLANITRYSRWSIAPIFIGALALMLLWGKEKV